MQFHFTKLSLSLQTSFIKHNSYGLYSVYYRFHFTYRCPFSRTYSSIWNMGICYLIPDYLEWIGYQKNMLSVYQNSDVIVLPSYREGLPKALIEACAIGRPIVTTDVPGCRECVKHGYNGYLVSVKTVNELADSIKELLLDADSRLIAEEEFSIERVIELTFRIYHEYINYKL